MALRLASLPRSRTELNRECERTSVTRMLNARYLLRDEMICQVLRVISGDRERIGTAHLLLNQCPIQEPFTKRLLAACLSVCVGMCVCVCVCVYVCVSVFLGSINDIHLAPYI